MPLYYVSIPEIDVSDGRQVAIQVAAHGEYHDRRQSADQWRDCYAAWPLAPFTVALLMTDCDGNETIETHAAVALPDTTPAKVSRGEYGYGATAATA